MPRDITPLPRVNGDALRSAVACMQEVVSYRSRMTPSDFAEFPHGQLLVGFVRGVAAGSGLPLDQFLDLVGAAGGESADPGALWTCLS